MTTSTYRDEHELHSLVMINRDSQNLVGIDVYESVNFVGVPTTVIHTTFKTYLGIVIDTYPRKDDWFTCSSDMYEVIMFDDDRIIRGWVYDYDVSSVE